MERKGIKEKNQGTDVELLERERGKIREGKKEREKSERKEEKEKKINN